MRFDDCRTEWRISDIERSLRDKVDRHELSSTNGDVARLEDSIRELSSLVDGLRYELQTCKEKLNYFEQKEYENIQ